MGTPIWQIEGVELDSTGEMVQDSLGDKVTDLLSHINARGEVYPTLAGGATVVSANANWTLGAFATIVPADTITSVFHIHAISIESCDRDAVFELVLYAGDPDVQIAHTRFAITGGFFGNIQDRITAEKVAANTRIRAKLASSNGAAQIATITMSIRYAEETL